MRGRQIIRVAGLIALLSLPAACGDAGSDEPTLGTPGAEGDQRSSEKIASPNFKVGDKVNFDAFEVTVTRVEQPGTVGVLDEKPSEGGTFVAVTYTLKNTGSKPLGMFDRPSLTLIDPQGNKYNRDANASAMFSIAQQFDAKGISDLNPGITTKDGDVWVVAKDKFDKKTWKVVLDSHENAPIGLE